MAHQSRAHRSADDPEDDTAVASSNGGPDHGADDTADHAEATVEQMREQLEPVLQALHQADPSPDQIKLLFDVMYAPEPEVVVVRPVIDGHSPSQEQDETPSVDEPYVLDGSSQSLLERVRSRKSQLVRGI